MTACSPPSPRRSGALLALLGALVGAWLAGPVRASEGSPAAPMAEAARAGAAPPHVAGPCASAAQAIPVRAEGAPSGSGFAQSMAGVGEPERDQAIRHELLAGNLPDFLRQVQPATLSARLPGGRAVRLTLCVLSDYLSVGSDEDFLRVPMGLHSALAVAARFGFTLPTRRMVDMIYRQAAVRLAPRPLPPDDAMRSTATYVQHQALVTQQLALLSPPLGLGALPALALVAGHKKDLVLSPRLWAVPGRVAIYGWHRATGEPIQPLSTVHGERYADYSHGVRLVGRTVWVDGVPRPILDLLADPQWAPLLSDEGPLPLAAGLLDAAALPAR